ncbi:hypothetical protein FXO38_34870 [Capsicum annuum]|nr:hypothetical protein FXO38_34870 [Capsicum annuum]KAF3671062.1 hypothetical protein FXO37_08220 [Capsicum annuum]
MDIFDLFVIMLLISPFFLCVVTFIIEFCTGADEDTPPDVANSTPVFVNVFDGRRDNLQAATTARVGGVGGAKDVTIVIDGISGKVNSTTKCGVCKKAILLESMSVDCGIRVNGGGDGGDGGPSHAK